MNEHWTFIYDGHALELAYPTRRDNTHRYCLEIVEMLGRVGYAN